MTKFLERLSTKEVLIADGATGTELQKAGLPRGVTPEHWNLENPEAIRNLHRSYITAGSDIILTNTFGGTRFRLERDHLQNQAREVSRVAACLAREVAEEKILVFGDIGPTGLLLQPYGKLTFDEATAAFEEQAAGLVEGGVDAILIETMSDLIEAKAAVEAVHRVTDLPLLVSFSFDTHGRTMMGVRPEQVIKEFWGTGVNVIGANCGRTLSETLDAIQAMRQAEPEAVLMAKPNAGLPHKQGTKETVYDVTPQIMGEYARRFAEQGVKIMGGCCGSTPEHVQAIFQALRS